MPLNPNFPCTSCGQCCRIVGELLVKKDTFPKYYRQELEAFPHKALENGTCEMLDAEGKCKVYQDRPTLCNINKMFLTHIRKFMNRKDFYTMQANTCNKMITEAGLGKKFLVTFPPATAL